VNSNLFLTIVTCLFLGMSLLFFSVFYYEYTCVKKYYPNMTITEYFILSDKIRITPNE